MYIQPRLREILVKLLDEHKSIKGEKLAETAGISTRTLRSDIKLLNEILEHVGAVISSTHNGYQLHVSNTKAFSAFYSNVSEPSTNVHAIPQENEQRIQYLLKRLLMTNTYIKAEELADDLFISKSSLTKLLKEVKNCLGSFDLTLIIRPNYGLKVEGEETQRRACISESFFQKRGEAPLLSQPSFFDSYFSKSEMEHIEKVVHQRLYEAQINVHDIGFENIVIHISVSIIRIQMGMEIQEFYLPIKIVDESEEFQVMSQILSDLSKLFPIHFSDGEKLYSTVHLIGNRLSSQGWVFEDKEKILSLVKNVLTFIHKEIGLELREDTELQTNLTTHLQFAFTRFMLGFKIRNPLLQEIISQYPLAYEAAILAGSVLEKKLKLSISKEETGFIAIHLQAAIERANGTRDPKRCLILCGTGKGSAVLLKYKLKDYFGGMLEVVDIIGYYDWKNYSIPSNIDFIISTISVDLKTTLPVLRVNSILGTPDFERIQQEFFRKRNHSKMSTVIYEDLIFLQRTFPAKEEVIRFLSDEVIKRGLAGSEFEQSVMEREKFTATAFGNLVAIPHPIKNISTKTFLSFCTLPKPIPWGTAPVQLVCLFSVKQNNEEDLQYLYDFLYEVLNDKDRVNQLVKIKTVEEFMNQLFLK